MTDEQDDLIAALPLRERYEFGRKVQAVLAIFKTPKQRAEALWEMLAMRDKLVEKVYKAALNGGHQQSQDKP